MLKNHHKERFLYLVIVIFLSSTLNIKAIGAEDKVGLSYGIKAGVNMNSLTTDFGFQDFRIGYQLGGFATYGMNLLNSTVSFEADLLYSNVGSSIIDPAKIYIPGTRGANTIIKSSVNMNALSVPILANYSFELSSINARIALGPEINYFISASANNTRIEYSKETISMANVTGSFQYFDFAGVIGLGIDIKNISVDLRYRKWLSTVNIIQSPSFSNFGLNSLSLVVGYAF